MNTDLEEIKSRLNIVDVLGEYLRLERSGTGYRALCPFHNEKSPSFMVSEEKQIWHCFGCQKGGDIFSFVMEIEGLEFREALKQLADKAGVKLEKFDSGSSDKKNRISEILELATKFYEYQLWSGPGRTKIMDYLKERGLNDETIKLFRLGYAPKGWRNIVQFLVKRGFAIEEINKTGLLVRKADASGGDVQGNYYDRFRERIMFPICDYSGKVLGYSARVAPGGDESQAKYVNTPETEVYHKSKILYGIDKAKSKIRQEDYVLLVEGNMDVIASHQAGIENVVAVSGTALTPTQLDILKRYTKNLKMLFDMDEAGEAATKKSAKLCFEKDFSLQIVELPFGKDAADVARNSPEKLRAAVGSAQNAMEYFFRKTFTSFDREKAEGKKQISNLLLEMIGHLSNNVERSHWLKKLASELDVSDTALTEEYKKVKINSSGRIEQKKDGALPKETLQPEKGKLELLLEEILGFSLVSSDVWKEIEKKVEYYPFFQQDKLLGFMLKNGGNLGYDFGRLLESVDAELKSRAESVFFQKKFRQGLDNGPEEIPPEYFQKDIDIVFTELGKEIKKLKLESIARDLRIAEGRKDEGAIKFLRQEFENILSRDI